ncbi:MAG: hypothetical protein FJ225_13205 [Lentisphaerae bacterium]|nr:hypothetical protein [Lentisphaerota bacterium]
MTGGDASVAGMRTQYEELKSLLARGWNTWNTRSVLSHVLLPEAFAVNLGLRHPTDGLYLKEALFGRSGKDEEQVRPGPHATDGSYTEGCSPGLEQKEET